MAPTLVGASDKTRYGRRVEAVERVLDAVASVPEGCVTSCGDVGRAAGVGARFVGRALARHGGEVAWWRVTNRLGELPEHLLGEAIERWRDEGIEVRPDGRGCLIARHRYVPQVP